MSKPTAVVVGVGAERGLGAAIEQLEPTRKMLANSFQGEPLECVGGVVNDLMADARGGERIRRRQSDGAPAFRSSGVGRQPNPSG